MTVQAKVPDLVRFATGAFTERAAVQVLTARSALSVTLSLSVPLSVSVSLYLLFLSRSLPVCPDFLPYRSSGTQLRSVVEGFLNSPSLKVRQTARGSRPSISHAHARAARDS